MSETIPLWSGYLKIDPTNIPTFTPGEEVVAVKFLPHESSRLKEDNFNWCTGGVGVSFSTIFYYVFCCLGTTHVKLLKCPKDALKAISPSGQKIHLKKYLTVSNVIYLRKTSKWTIFLNLLYNALITV